MHLGEMLIEQGELSPAQLREALRIQELRGGRLGTNLLELGFLDEDTLLATLGRQRSTKTASRIELRQIRSSVVKLIPAKLAERFGLVPFELKGRTLLVASRDPGDPLKEDEIGFLASCMVRTCLALEVRVAEALERYYRVPSLARHQALAQRLGSSGRKLRANGQTQVESRPSPARPKAVEPAAGGSGSPSRQKPAPRVATTRLVGTTGESAPPASPAPAPQLFIELDEEDTALLALSSDQPPAAATPGTEQPSQLAAAPLPWLARQPTDAGTPPAGEPAESQPDPGAASASASQSVEERLEEASDQLQHAEIRDDIADVLLAFCAPYFCRRLLLVVRGGHIVGWRGEGDGIEADQIRTIQISRQEPSVFFGLRDAESFWLSGLPELDANQQLAVGLGGDPPKDCLVLPVTLRSRVVSYLYCDNLDAGVSGAPLAELRRLATKAGLAFEVYMLKNKIRIL